MGGDAYYFVPSYSATFKDAKQLVKELETYWNARVKLSAKQQEHCKNIGRTLGVDEKKAFRRWLAYKPPE